MDFFSDCYRKTKLGISGLGTIGSSTTIVIGIVVTHGALAGVLIGAGIVWLATSAFTLFDTLNAYSIIKKDVEKLRKNLDNFESENFALKTNLAKLNGDIKSLSKTKDSFISENKKLAESIEDSSHQLKKLTHIKENYEKIIDKNTKLLEEEKVNIENLDNAIKELEAVKKTFEIENTKLQELNSNNLEYINELENIKDQYVEENKKMKELNIDNKKQLEYLEGQVLKLKELYVNTKELMRNIVNAGDTFGDLSEDINTSSRRLGETREDYDETLGQMKNLLERLKNKTFDQLDQNDDGLITEDEFRNEISSI